MFVVFLRFSAGKSEAPRLMADHNAWIARGFEDGVFMVVGALQPGAGGAILAHDTTRAELEARLQEDPFVAEDVVRTEIEEIAPARVEQRLSFLLK